MTSTIEDVSKKHANRSIPTPESQGFALQSEDEWRTWPTLNQVATKLDMPAVQLRALVRHKAVPALHCTDSTWRMRPDDVEALAASFEIESDDAEAGVTSKKNIKERAEVNLLKGAVDLLKQAQDHVQKMVSSLVVPQQKALELLVNYSDTLQKRVAALESNRDELQRQKETLANENTIRDLATNAAKEDEQRKNELWKMLLDRAPHLLGQVEASILEKHPDHGPKILAARDLVTSLEPAMLVALLEGDLLTAEQKEKVKIITQGTSSTKPNGKKDEPKEQPKQEVKS